MNARAKGPPAIAGARLAPPGRDYSKYVGVALLAVLVGLTATEQQTSHGAAWKALLICLVLVGYLSITLSLEPELLFAGWLFFAPIFQESVAKTTVAKELGRALYVVPPLVLALLIFLRRSDRGAKAVDVLPGLYFAYVVVSGTLIANPGASLGGTFHHVYMILGIGIIAYYFLTFGPSTDHLGARVATALIGGGSVVAAMAIFERLTGWNVWHDTAYWRGHGITRVVATLANPAVLGTFLGMALCFAISILLWNGPESLRRPSKGFIVLALPALFFTYTRGPMIAILVVACAMGIIAARARWPTGLLLVAATASLILLSGTLTSSSLYQSRFGDTHNIDARLILQRASFTLAGRRPIAGWGYGSFDRVKNDAALQSADPQTLAYNTSHDTFLTVLVELGAVGVGLLLLPWLIISGRAIGLARRAPRHRWILAAAVGSVGVYCISAATYDVRFFSLISCLPWVMLGVARRTLAEGETQLKSR